MCQCDKKHNSIHKLLLIFGCDICIQTSVYLLTIQTGNEKTFLSSNTVVMFYSWVVRQVTTALCFLSVYQEARDWRQAMHPPPESAPLWTAHCMRMQISPGGLDETLVSAQSVLHTVIKEMHKKARCQFRRQPRHSLGVWTVRALRTGGGWEDWTHANLEARLCFTTVTLSQYYWDQLQWCFQPFHMYLYVHADLWAYLLSWIQFYNASVKVN